MTPNALSESVFLRPAPVNLRSAAAPQYRDRIHIDNSSKSTYVPNIKPCTLISMSKTPYLFTLCSTHTSNFPTPWFKNGALVVNRCPTSCLSKRSHLYLFLKIFFPYPFGRTIDFIVNITHLEKQPRFLHLLVSNHFPNSSLWSSSGEGDLLIHLVSKGVYSHIIQNGMP